MGQSPNRVSKKNKEESRLSNEEWRRYFTGHWDFAGCKQGEHTAMFPDELPLRLIKMFSFVGEIILDPFLGSGTTSKVARRLRRNSIGYEINKSFLPIIEDKINKNSPSLFDREDVIEIIRQSSSKNDDNNHLLKIGENNKTINNRINHPEYWKELRA